MAIGKPFTTDVAKDTAPEELWGSPGFKMVNMHITLVFVAAFGIMAACGAVRKFVQTLPSTYTHYNNAHAVLQQVLHTVLHGNGPVGARSYWFTQ